MNDTTDENECYLCFDNKKTKLIKPCCLFVHSECLDKYIEMEMVNECLECKKKYEYVMVKTIDKNVYIKTRLSILMMCLGYLFLNRVLQIVLLE